MQPNKNVISVFNALSDSYVNNEPFDYTKIFPQKDWEEFEKFCNVDESKNEEIRNAILILREVSPINDQAQHLEEVLQGMDPKNIKSKKQIFDFICEVIGWAEIPLETICRFKNLSWALTSGLNKETVECIIKNKLEFNEFIRSNRVMPISRLKFSDIDYHLSGSFENWQTDTSILDGCYAVRLCDYLGVAVKTVDKTPANWNVQEYEFEEFAETFGKEKLKDFARLFKKPMNKWYSNSWCD